MLTTIDYDAVKARLGQRLYRAVGCSWDGDDVHVVVSGEYRNVGAAKLVSRSWVAHRGDLDHIEIRRGEWVERVIREAGRGPVRDADFEEEDGRAIRGWVDAEGRIDWEAETW
ncbi:MAG: hypothetical protein ACRD2C_08765 [Acidimicrobiales bacterium]